MFLEPLSFKTPKSGRVELIVGSMFSGKTEELLRRIRRVEISGQKFVLIKPEIDNRYREDAIVSHDKNMEDAKVCKQAFEIFDHVQEETVVAIDEAQFFDSGILDVVHTLANRGKRVIIAGLSMNAKGAAFGTMPQLLATAEHITKLHAICQSCGGHAHFSKRKPGKDGQGYIGGNELYTPLCRACYLREP